MASLACVAMLLPSCSSDCDELSESLGNVDTEVVRFKSGMNVTSRHTDAGFQYGDVIYIYPMEPGDVSLPQENRAYWFDGSAFVPASGTSDIYKKAGEQMTYFAINDYEQRMGNEFSFRSGDYDYLVTVAESSSSEVELVFTHLMSRLFIEIRGASTSINKVTLLGVNTEVGLDGVDLTMSYDPLPDTEVSMKYSSEYGSYVYYLPPVVYAYKSKPFIRIYTADGRTYLFGPPSDIAFEMNQQYFWTADLSTANPESSSRDAGLGQPVNTVSYINK